MLLHYIGIGGLVVVLTLGTLRPINLGVLALVMAFVVSTFVAGEAPREMYSGFPVDLLILLTGVTYLFGVAMQNGTVKWIVEGSVRAARNRRALIPWVVFALAAAPAMAGALGSTGVALLAPLAMRVAERCALDRRMIDGGARRCRGQFLAAERSSAICITTTAWTIRAWCCSVGIRAPIAFRISTCTARRRWRR